LKFRPSTQLFLCRRNIMEHLCSSWLMDWALPFLPEPHLISCPSPGVHSSPWHLFTWKRPPRVRCLTFTSTLHLPPLPDHHFLANPTMPIPWPAGEEWMLHIKFFDVHECLDCCTVTSFRSTHTRSVPGYSSVSVFRFAR
jgi:hypothetical protein